MRSSKVPASVQKASVEAMIGSTPTVAYAFVMLTYSTLLETSYKLLICTPFLTDEGESINIMRYAGEEQCWTSNPALGAAIFLVLTVLSAVPFLILFMQSFGKRGIAFRLMNAAKKSCSSRRRRVRQQNKESSSPAEIEPPLALLRILARIEAPYKEGYGWWESTLLVRRIVIVLLYALVEDPLTKSFSLLVVMVFVHLAHSSVRPFRTRLDNTVETISLSILLLLSALGCLSAYPQSAAVEDVGLTIGKTEVYKLRLELAASLNNAEIALCLLGAFYVIFIFLKIIVVGLRSLCRQKGKSTRKRLTTPSFGTSKERSASLLSADS
uniref:Uncharacterized protein n=1 Tax=Palpitomonas bilix TaxID=652834 RepID=A0A7S3GF41_9EUKA